MRESGTFELNHVSLIDKMLYLKDPKIKCKESSLLQIDRALKKISFRFCDDF